MKNKTFFLLFALMLGFATVNAQSNDEKYEYAIVEYVGGKTIHISTSDGVNEERNINNNPALKFPVRKEILEIIKEMNDKGWQVINAGSPSIYTIYLQKKRTN